MSKYWPRVMRQLYDCPPWVLLGPGWFEQGWSGPGGVSRWHTTLR